MGAVHLSLSMDYAIESNFAKKVVLRRGSSPPLATTGTSHHHILPQCDVVTLDARGRSEVALLPFTGNQRRETA